MSVTELVCQYCSHRNLGSASRCGHCGAPLVAAAVGGLLAAERLVTGAAKAAAATEHAVAGAENAKAGAEKVAAEKYPQWQWRAAIAAIVLVVVVLGIALTHSCSVPLAAMPDLGVAPALPAQLGSAASCQRVDTAAETCSIRADNPMLAGGITGGKDLSISVGMESPDHRGDTVRAWRASGGTILADGPVFLAIGPSATLRYANTLVGLHFETSAFNGRAAVQTFITRAGLTP